MFGPHFYYDLIRLARKRRNLVLRCGYLIALLLGWWFVYEEQTVTRHYFLEITRQTAKYSNALLMFQYALILLVTPIYLAGTIMEEKENRTLELLFQTDLSDQEIILGKFAARIVQLLVLAPAALPMLALINLWGGVAYEPLILHLAFSVLLILFLGMATMWASALARSFPEAVAIAYGLIFFCGVALIAGGIILVENRVHPFFDELARDGITSLKILAVVLTLLAAPLLLGCVLFYMLALWQFRRLRELKWIKERVGKAAKVEDKPPVDVIDDWTRPTRDVPDNALAWKEMRRSRDAAILDQLIWVMLALVLIAGGLHLRQVWERPVPPERHEFADILRVMSNMGYLAVVAVALLAQAILATSSVARESEHATLDFLLLLPLERAEILLWKWLGPWCRARVLLLLLIAIPIVGIASGMYSIRLGLLFLVLPWPLLFLVHCLGVLLSVMARRVMFANFAMIAGLLVLLLLHLLRWNDVVLILESIPELLFSFSTPRPLNASATARLTRFFVVQQIAFLLLALLSAGLSYWMFTRKTSETRTRVW